MAETALRVWTLEEFLAWDEAQEGAHEFDGVEPIPMNPPTTRHQVILLELLDALRRSAKPVRVLPGVMIVTKEGRARRIPDIAVVPRDAPLSTPVGSPIVVVEIASPSTSRTDTVAKVAEYTALPTLRHYLLLEQARAAGTLHSRNPDGFWTAQSLQPGASVALAELDLRFPLDDCYAGLPDEA
ncbi:MAG TPA: Uma2 family endonuclease [Acidisphaera sp.]|nr:Uma2 family endonuclease [Acidisphaera sp.]